MKRIPSLTNGPSCISNDASKSWPRKHCWVFILILISPQFVLALLNIINEVAWSEEAENKKVIMRDRKRAADSRNCRRWKMVQEETVTVVKSWDKNTTRCTECWTDFKQCLGQTAADTAGCIRARWQKDSLPQTRELRQLWSLHQVMNQKAILVPTHLDTEPQLAPISFSDFEGSSPRYVNPEN